MNPYMHTRDLAVYVCAYKVGEPRVFLDVEAVAAERQSPDFLHMTTTSVRYTYPVETFGRAKALHVVVNGGKVRRVETHRTGEYLDSLVDLDTLPANHIPWSADDRFVLA